MSPSPTVAPCHPSVCTCPALSSVYPCIPESLSPMCPCPWQAPEFLRSWAHVLQYIPVYHRVSPGPSMCPDVPQDVPVAAPDTEHLRPPHSNTGSNVPRHPMTPHNTLCPLILSPFPLFWGFLSSFVLFPLILGPFPLFWVPSSSFGCLPLAFGTFLPASPSSNPLPALKPPFVSPAVSLCIPPHHMDSVLTIMDALESPPWGDSRHHCGLGEGPGGMQYPRVLGEPAGTPDRPLALTPGLLLTELLHNWSTPELGAVMAPDVAPQWLSLPFCLALRQD